MEWFCTKCHRVWSAQKGNCSCKGVVVEFDLQKYGKYLISNSNAWTEVYEKWENDPLFKEKAQEYIKDGCYSAPIIFNAFIEKLRQEDKEVK